MAALFGTADGQPAARRVLRADVGRAGGAVAGDRTGLASGLAGAHGVPAAPAGPPARRSRLSPAPWATGPRRWACSRSCGWSSPVPTRDRCGAIKTVAAGSTSSSRWRAQSSAATSGSPAPTRSRCTASWHRGSRRCAATRRAAASRSATRSTICRRCRSGRAPSRCSRCCWAPPRSTASRRCRCGATSSTGTPTSAADRNAAAHRGIAGVHRRRGRDVLARGASHRRRRQAHPTRATGRDGALADPDRARIRVRALSVLSRSSAVSRPSSTWPTRSATAGTCWASATPK